MFTSKHPIYALVFLIAACGTSETVPSRTTTSQTSQNLSTTSDPSSSYTIIGLGSLDGSHAEFPDNFPPQVVTYHFGVDSASNIRSWVGHSNCSAPCGDYVKGYPRDQIFAFSNLVVGTTYELIIYPMGSAGASTFFATPYDGSAQILRGGSKTWKTPGDGYAKLTFTDRWVITFTAQSTELSLKIGNGLSTGDNYFYFDYIEFLR